MIVVVMVFCSRSSAQAEKGVNGVKRSSVILLQSDQLSLLLMQMFGLEAEGSVQCATLLWQSSGVQGSVLALAWSLWASSLSEPAHIVVSLSLSLTGDNYPVQFIPSTMAAAAASGLSPLQLQVCTVLWQRMLGTPAKPRAKRIAKQLYAK